jgi:hypothetical protein
MPTSAKSETFKHMNTSHAVAIADAINNTVSADKLCRAAIPYPTAIALAAIISGGLGGAKEIEALHRLGFSASDAAAIAAASVAKGAH